MQTHLRAFSFPLVEGKLACNKDPTDTRNRYVLFIFHFAILNRKINTIYFAAF